MYNKPTWLNQIILLTYIICAIIFKYKNTITLSSYNNLTRLKKNNIIVYLCLKNVYYGQSSADFALKYIYNKYT